MVNPPKFAAVLLIVSNPPAAMLTWPVTVNAPDAVLTLPVTTVIGLQVGALLAGAVLTETVFTWNGVGSWVVTSIQNHDYIVVQSLILIFATIFLTVNLIVDVGYAFLNPRIRYS